MGGASATPFTFRDPGRRPRPQAGLRDLELSSSSRLFPGLCPGYRPQESSHGHATDRPAPAPRPHSTQGPSQLSAAPTKRPSERHLSRIHLAASQRHRVRPAGGRASPTRTCPPPHSSGQRLSPHLLSLLSGRGLCHPQRCSSPAGRAHGRLLTQWPPVLDRGRQPGPRLEGRTRH